MKKNITAILFLLVVIFLYGCKSEYVPTATDYFEFEIVEDHAVLVSYSGTLSKIVVPEKYKEYDVTVIGDRAFQKNKNIKNITIGNNIKQIDNFAFLGCSNLEYIEIPKSVKKIGVGILTNCVNLKSIVVDPENNFYDSRNECKAIIETKTNTLIMGCNETAIPLGVTAIAESAFSGCNKMVSIIIPNTVTIIKKSAFSNCSKIRIITIPSSVKSIERNAFYNCSSLSDIVIPKEVENLGNDLFYGCDYLTIRCEVSEPLSSWEYDWNSTGLEVIWDYKNKN